MEGDQSAAAFPVGQFGFANQHQHQLHNGIFDHTHQQQYGFINTSQQQQNGFVNSIQQQKDAYRFANIPQQQQGPGPHASMPTPNQQDVLKEAKDREVYEITGIFITSYYQLMETGPQYLYRFHGYDTYFTHGDDGPTVTGLEQIKIRLAELNYNKNIQNRIAIKYVESYEVLNKTISIIVQGKIRNSKEPAWRPFVQTFVLNLVNLNSTKYYVKVDNFKYLDCLFEGSFNFPDNQVYYQLEQQPQQPQEAVSTSPSHSSLYAKETVNVVFVPYVLDDPNQYQLLTPHYYSYPAGNDVQIQSEIDLPTPHYSTVLEDNKNEQNEILNDETKELTELSNMDCMISTFNQVVNINENIVLEKDLQTQEVLSSLQEANDDCKSPSLKPDEILQSSTAKNDVFQNEVMKLSKTKSTSDISDISLSSMDSSKTNLNDLLPSLPFLEPQVNEDKDIPSYSVENSKIEQEKQQKDDKVEC